ncbi:MAG: TonB-dependent receptor [Planctomycetota bacterium]
MNLKFLAPRRVAGLALCAVFAPVVQAQPASPPASPASSRRATVLDPVVITGNPLRSGDIAAPVSVLRGDELVLRRGTSLGETVNGLPGVSSSYFGPNANRPVIRGLDGDRVRIINNAGASLDASSLSFDHAVPIDPLVIERVEVLRGPGALLYGGSAIGGVVNALDNRIPKYSLAGVSGAGEVRLGGAERERGGAALVEAGNGRFAIHADAFGRRTSDLSVPRYTPIEDGVALDRTNRIRNSASRTSGGALGGSMTSASGYLGASVDTYDSTYGIVAEPDVVIRMKREHVAVAGEMRDLGGPFKALRLQLNDTRYRHEEVEGSGAIGTTFRSSGTEVRIEAEHVALGPFRGVIGGQFENFDFSALGDEAFVPSTTTRRQALFVLEEATWPLGTLTAGLRVERARVASAGDADPMNPKFGPAGVRTFSPRSASLANVYKLDPAWSLAATLSASERAPTSFELYANGVHAATGTYERGDPQLGVERGHNLDLSLGWKVGADALRLGVFQARFSRFIALEASGAVISLPDGSGGFETFDEYVFRSVKARLSGIEIEGRRRLVERGWTLDLSGKIDYTRATNLDSGEPLPRFPPLRARLNLDAGYGPWNGRIELEAAARQSRVPATDSPTAGYGLVHLALTRRFSLGASDAFWFVKLTNVGDKLAYSAATVATVRDLSPLPGRGLKAGIRVNF